MMKKSNIGLAVLALVFLSAWLGNIYYHKYNFVNNKWRLDKSELFDSVRDSIKVVSVIDSTNRLSGKINIVRDEKWSLTVTNIEAYYKSMVIVNDTLVITNDFAKATRGGNEVMLSLSLPGVKAYYYNQKLMKRFDNEIMN